MKYILLILLLSGCSKLTPRCTHYIIEEDGSYSCAEYASNCDKPTNLKDLLKINEQLKPQEPQQPDIQFKKA